MRTLYSISILFLLFSNILFSQVSVGLKWEKYFGQKDKLEAKAIIQNFQGNIVVVGDAKNVNKGKRGAFFIEFNQDGDILHSIIDFYGGSANVIAQTPDGGYLLAGCVETKVSKSKIRKNAWLVKLSEKGKILWTRRKKEANSEFYDLVQDKKGNLIACGHAMDKIFISHFSCTGDSIQQDTKHGDSKYPLIANSIINTSDGGFALIANAKKEKKHSEYFLLKLNEKGDSVWQRSWDGYEAHDIIQAKSGDIVIVGAEQVGFADVMKTTHYSRLFIQKVSLEGIESAKIVHQKNSDKDTGHAILQGFNKDYYIASQSDYTYDMPRRAGKRGQQIWLQHISKDRKEPWYYGQVLLGDGWKLLPTAMIQLCNGNLIITGYTPKNSVIAKLIPRDYPKYHEAILSVDTKAYQEIKGNNNGVLEPEERGYYSFNLKNEGKNDVYNVIAKINNPNWNNNIKVFPNVHIGHIAGGDSKLVQIPIIASGTPIDGEHHFNIELMGFHNKHITSVEFEINSSSTPINSPLKKVIKPASKPSNLYLLSIGVSQPNLQFTTKDAAAIAKAYKEQEGKLFDKVITKVLNTKFDTNVDTLRKSISRIFGDMPGGLQKEDLVIVYISSHGFVLEDGRFRIAAQDYDKIDIGNTTLDVHNHIYEDLNKLECNRLVLLDVCQEVLDMNDYCPPCVPTSKNGRKIADVMGEYKDVLGINSCSPNQFSYEDEEWGHGAFTKALLEAFEDSSLDKDNNGTLSISELYDFLKNRVPQIVRTKKGLDISETQVPDMPESQLNNNFPVIGYDKVK